jgi:hypothetical protein
VPTSATILARYSSGRLTQEEALEQLGALLAELIEAGRPTQKIDDAISAVLDMSEELEADDPADAEEWENLRNGK